jgi:sugar/nucleoside kinase (ribokinase family)
VGDDFPERFERALRDAGIDLRGVERVLGARSPSCYIVVDRGGRQFTLIDQGPMADEDSDARAPPDEILGRVDWLHLATGPPGYQLRLQEAARRRGVRVAADPAQEIHYLWRPAPLRRLLAHAELFFGNEAEVRAAARALGLSGPRRLVEIVPLVVATLGPRGAVAYSRLGAERVPIPGRPPARHYVGAGDSFRGGFYAAWFRGAPLRECLTGGSAAALEWIRSGGEEARAEPNGAGPARERNTPER